MNYTHRVNKRKHKHDNSLKLSNQMLIKGVDQNKTVQDDLDGENVSVYLNLSNDQQERDYSCDEDQREQTKKNNFIIKKKNILNQQFVCGYCNKVFIKSCSLGGHVQKNHRIEKNQMAKLSQMRKIILRERHNQNR